MGMDWERYARQTALPEIGREGQERLAGAAVLVVGAGGLGSPVLQYLAASGVGRLGIVDGDRVESSNLQRQIAHGEGDLGRMKTESARESVLRIASGIAVETFGTMLDRDNADAILAGYDAAVGCVDDIAARYALDAACVRAGKAHVYGAIRGFEGQAGVFGGGGGACYRCFFREPPEEGWRPDAADRGVLGAVAGMIGCVQATETIKSILGIGGTLSGRLLLFDGLAMRFREIAVKRDPHCPVCGPNGMQQQAFRDRGSGGRGI